MLLIRDREEFKKELLRKRDALQVQKTTLKIRSGMTKRDLENDRLYLNGTIGGINDALTILSEWERYDRESHEEEQ